MSKIKVGQVYKFSLTDTIRVVTSIGYNTVSTIDTYGEFERWIYSSLIEICNGIWELVAEYPTWQEAVNSKEFNNAT